MSTDVAVDPLARAWELTPATALRPEPFGALAYHFGNRALTFLKHPRLAAVVAALSAHPDGRGALQAAGVPPAHWPAYSRALARLATKEMIRPRTDPEVNSADRATLAAPAPGIDLGRIVDAPYDAQPRRLVDQFELGLDAPICLTWELTYACNLACAHCLSSSGRRDPRELTTAQCEAVIDELQRLQVFYVNVGGGEPTVRSDFWHLLEYAGSHHVGVKFSTNGVNLSRRRAIDLARNDYVDVQISLDGATADVNDYVRGRGAYDTAIRALANLADAGFEGTKISVVCTRHNIGQLDEFQALADRYGATLRLTRLRPSGRGADVWDELHPLPGQQRQLYDWLRERGERVLTGDSFFHLAGYGEALPGLNLCGAGRVVCLIDPIGDVYACPFAIHDEFKAGNVVGDGGFTSVWRDSELFARLRRPTTGGACTGCAFFDGCRGGCMAAKFFTGLPLDGPDPECVQGYGESALRQPRAVPPQGQDHSRGVAGPHEPVMVTLGRRRPMSPCNESPLTAAANEL